MKDSSVDVKVASPGRLVYGLVPDALEFRKKHQELMTSFSISWKICSDILIVYTWNNRPVALVFVLYLFFSNKHPQREAPGSLDRQKSSSSHKEPSLVEEQQPSYSRENDEKSYSRCSKAKETESLTVEDNSNRGEVSDSDLEEGYKRKTGSKEKKRHRKSDRRDTSSDSEDSYDTELERKETRRRKKEERRLRKEKKRQKREERRRKKEERRAEKTKAKNLSDDYSDDDRVAKEESYPSDAADEAEHRRLEIELRKKALESFNARKGTRSWIDFSGTLSCESSGSIFLKFQNSLYQTHLYT